MADLPKLYFRADGNARIGLGHLMRCMAIAEMVKNYFHCHFITQAIPESIQQQLHDLGFEHLTLPESEDLELEAAIIAKKYGARNELFVLDGYHFSTSYQWVLKKVGAKVVCIDDVPSIHFVADAVINHAGGMQATDYSAENYTRFFLGLPYAMLRRPFRAAAGKRIYPKREAGNVFICLGGADPKNDTLKVLEQCAKVSLLRKCYLVLGAAYPHRKALSDFLKNTDLEVEVLSNLSANEMVRYMGYCPWAITPPSTISYEYLSVGGLLFLYQTADNQKNIKKYFLDEGLAFTFERFPEISQDAEAIALRKQAELLDGNTAGRIIELFQNL